MNVTEEQILSIGFYKPDYLNSKYENFESISKYIQRNIFLDITNSELVIMQLIETDLSTGIKRSMNINKIHSFEHLKLLCESFLC